MAGTTAVLFVAPLLFTDIVTLLRFLVSGMIETLLGVWGCLVCLHRQQIIHWYLY